MATSVVKSTPAGLHCLSKKRRKHLIIFHMLKQIKVKFIPTSK